MTVEKPICVHCTHCVTTPKRTDKVRRPVLWCTYVGIVIVVLVLCTLKPGLGALFNFAGSACVAIGGYYSLVEVAARNTDTQKTKELALAFLGVGGVLIAVGVGAPGLRELIDALILIVWS